MPESLTPGQVAWRAYQHMDPMLFWDEWDRLHAIERQAWEAAAQAVLARAQQEEEDKV
mgnify:CR=1 FL=1